MLHAELTVKINNNLFQPGQFINVPVVKESNMEYFYTIEFDYIQGIK